MAITRKLSTPPIQPPVEPVAVALPDTSSSVPPPPATSSPGVPQVDEDETMADVEPSKALNDTEQDVIDLTSAEHQTPLETTSRSQTILNNLIKKVTILFATYTILMENDPDSNATNNAYDAYIAANNSLEKFKASFSSFKTSIANAAPASEFSVRRAVVPSGLPFLQLKGDSIWKQNQDAYDSAFDFCTAFETILRAHVQPFDSNWERLFPMCLNSEQISWFEENLSNKALQWSEAKVQILNFFDTPYRKFMLMAEVGTLRQDSSETTREYASRYQKLRREAGLEDGTQLAVAFFISLRDNVRARSQVAIATHFGSILPTSINQIMDLVLASGEDSGLAPPSKRMRNNSVNKVANLDTTNKTNTSTHNNNKFNKDKLCSHCNKVNWFPGHKCVEYKLKKFNKTSRMARRTTQDNDNDNDSQNNDDQDQNDKTSFWKQFAEEQNHNATLCKLPTITKDFNKTNDSITFPVKIENHPAFALLDTGANFSSINYKFCIKNKINIDYIKSKNNLPNKISNEIKLADSNTTIKRIGTCKISTVTCNNNTISNRTFEVMNLTDDYDLSIGTDFMSSFGIAIAGLPISFKDSNPKSLLERSRKYSNDSELLTEIERENAASENSPAGTTLEYTDALAFIQPFIDNNQNIPNGTFCNLPESVVSIETPPGKTGYRRPYPVPLVYHDIVDKQIATWLEEKFIERTTKSSEWNCPITVVKKTNGKGEVTGHRVCHDPRHINALLQDTDRMPLPIISELFEDLHSATVYSTCDLKSAFNSLKLNPLHKNKLNFTWRGIQYTPLGCVFGIKHISSHTQRLLSHIFSNSELSSFTRHFIDDIVIFSPDITSHRVHVQRVIEKLTEVNLKLQPSKCKFFQREIHLLGFRISPRGVSMDRRKLINVMNFPTPKTYKDIQRYTGLIQYFSSLIPNISTIMAPLNPLRYSKDVAALWNNEHQTAFENLKEALLHDTVLSFPNLQEKFYVGCDASNVGIGILLFQKIHGQTKYISMHAKTLSKSERNYSTTKKELLAVVYALKKFHKYLWGNHFILYSDHKALCYLHTQKIANIMMINWLDTILQYDFTIVHLPGIDNKLCDMLSRLFESPNPVNELGEGNLKLISRAAIIDKSLPNINSGEYMTPPTPEERKELLIDEHLKGHFGSDAIYYALKRKGIYWKDLKNEAAELIKSCTPCQQFNIVRKGYHPLRPITCKLPGDSWGLDLAGPFKTSSQGNNYLLIMVDIATRYCVLKPIQDKSALSIVKELVNLISTFGVMRSIQSDNGSEFLNESISLLAEHSGFEHRLVSRYHPRANGISERFVQSSVNVIKKRVVGAAADWDLYVPSTMLYLNCKYNERTKTAPFTMMFGRTAGDFDDFSREKDTATREQINQDLIARIKNMTEIVFPAIYERTLIVAGKQKKRFDATHKLVKIPEGAHVMIKVTEKGNKLDPNYIGMYKVKRITKGGSYVLENEKGQLEPKNFPPFLLKMVSQDPIISTDDFYNVEAIIGHKKVKGKYLYNVRWKNYTSKHDSYEPESNFVDPKFITQYWQRIGKVPEKFSWKDNYKNDISLINKRMDKASSINPKRKTSANQNNNESYVQDINNTVSKRNKKNKRV